MDNPPLERTAAAVLFLSVERRTCAAAAAQRPYVMRRTFLNIATVVSVLLGLTVCVLWVRSNRRGDQLGFAVGGRRFEVRSQGGALSLYEFDVFPWYIDGPAASEKQVARYNSKHVFGFAYWVALAPMAALPATWFVRGNRVRGRVAKGLCLRCGYDLRGSPDRCPECGDGAARTAA